MYVCMYIQVPLGVTFINLTSLIARVSQVALENNPDNPNSPNSHDNPVMTERYRLVDEHGI